MRFRTGYDRNGKGVRGGFRGYIVETDTEFGSTDWRHVRKLMVQHVAGNPELFPWYHEGMDIEELHEWAETIICRMSRCAKSHCDGDQDNDDDTAEVTIGEAKEFIEKLAPFLMDGGFELVDQETAEARAAECAACPKNRPARGWGCGFCGKLVDFVMGKLAGRTTSLSHRLESCVACKCRLKAAVFCPDDVLRATSPEGAKYADCWKNKIVNGDPEDQPSE